MCTYTGEKDDPLRHSSLRLTEEGIIEMATTLVNSKFEDCSKVGLNPFCKLNPPPGVSLLISLTLLHHTNIT